MEEKELIWGTPLRPEVLLILHTRYARTDRVGLESAGGQVTLMTTANQPWTVRAVPEAGLALSTDAALRGPRLLRRRRPLPLSPETGDCPPRAALCNSSYISEWFSPTQWRLLSNPLLGRRKAAFGHIIFLCQQTTAVHVTAPAWAIRFGSRYNSGPRKSRGTALSRVWGELTGLP